MVAMMHDGRIINRHQQQMSESLADAAAILAPASASSRLADIAMLEDLWPSLNDPTSVPKRIRKQSRDSFTCLQQSVQNFHDGGFTMHPCIEKACRSRSITNVTEELLKHEVKVRQTSDKTLFRPMKKDCETLQDAADFMRAHGQYRAIICLRLKGTATRSAKQRKRPPKNHFVVLRFNGTTTFLLDSDTGTVKPLSDGNVSDDYDLDGGFDCYLLEFLSDSSLPQSNPSVEREIIVID